jgi:hypothetical protein
MSDRKLFTGWTGSRGTPRSRCWARKKKPRRSGASHRFDIDHSRRTIPRPALRVSGGGKEKPRRSGAETRGRQVDPPRLPSYCKRQHIPRAAFRALPPLRQVGDERPRFVACNEFVNRPRMLVSAALAPDTYGPDLAMVLERGERHLPSFARLLKHGVSIAAGAQSTPPDYGPGRSGEAASHQVHNG